MVHLRDTAPDGIASAATGVVAPRHPAFWPRLAIALCAGLVTACAFPPYGLEWIAPVGPAVLTVCCRRMRVGRSAWLGFAYGLGFCGLLLRWTSVAGIDGWAGLSVLQAAFLAGLGAVLALVTRLRAWPLWAACAWIGIELARSTVPFGGFPWGRLGFAMVDTPFASYAALGGVPLVGFAAALAGTLLAWAVITHGRRLARGAAVVGAAVLPALALLIPLPTAAQDGHFTVGIVQGNVPGKGLEFLGRARTVTNNHLKATQDLMRRVRAGKVPAPQALVWPENSTDIDPFHDPKTRRTIERAVQAAGVPILVGTMLDGPKSYQVRNVGIIWDPRTGPGQRYQKQHPVPFGEYIPFREYLAPIIGKERMSLVPRDMVAGHRPGLMRLGPARIGDLICFEVAYDGLVNEVARDGAQVLVVQTNNSTFLGSGQLEQQFDITRMRAIEHGRAILVASPSGLSGVIAPDGTVVDKSQESTRTEFVDRVPLRSGSTLATVLGTIPAAVLAILAGLAAAVALVRRRRRDRARTDGARTDGAGTDDGGDTGAPKGVAST